MCPPAPPGRRTTPRMRTEEHSPAHRTSPSDPLLRWMCRLVCGSPRALTCPIRPSRQQPDAGKSRRVTRATCRPLPTWSCPHRSSGTPSHEIRCPCPASPRSHPRRQLRPLNRDAGSWSRRLPGVERQRRCSAVTIRAMSPNHPPDRQRIRQHIHLRRRHRIPRRRSHRRPWRRRSGRSRLPRRPSARCTVNGAEEPPPIVERSAQDSTGESILPPESTPSDRHTASKRAAVPRTNSRGMRDRPATPRCFRPAMSSKARRSRARSNRAHRPTIRKRTRSTIVPRYEAASSPSWASTSARPTRPSR